MKRLFIALITLVLATAMFAQQPEKVPFNGLVVTATGQGVKVKITIKGTSLTTTSNRDGKFGFTSVRDNDTLVVKYKKENIEIPINGRKSIKINLIDNYRASAEFVPELVDLGYGYINRREMTGTSHGINAEVFERGIFTNLGDAIRATYPSAQVGSDGNVIIRGTSTINGSANALILLDGTPIESLNDVNVHEIKSVEVSADGSMYGSRGGTGIVLIRTK